jgi:nucleoside-diphosphate-sugar epimerase
MSRRTVASPAVPILVTGGLGFIGGHLVDILVASGATDVRVFDNGRRAVTRVENWPRETVRLIEGDIRDIDALQHARLQGRLSLSGTIQCHGCSHRS